MAKYLDHSDEGVLREFRKGNEKAFHDLFINLYPAICYHSLQYTKEQFAAEEIAEDTFIKVWNRKEDFSNFKQLKAFIYLTAQNASIDWLRKTQLQESKHKAWQSLQNNIDKNIFDKLVQTEIFRELHAAIETLPPQTKKVIKMTFFEGKKNIDVAKELGITVSTVVNLKAIGVRKLKGKLPIIFSVLLLMGGAQDG